MFRIGIVELGITCGLIALAIIVPWIVTRGYAVLSRRLKDIEEKIAKKR
jgi:hypothetical protein